MNYFSQEDFEMLCAYLEGTALQDFTDMFVQSGNNYVFAQGVTYSDYEDWVEELYGEDFDPNTCPFLVFTGVLSGSSTQGGGTQ